MASDKYARYEKTITTIRNGTVLRENSKLGFSQISTVMSGLDPTFQEVDVATLFNALAKVELGSFLKHVLDIPEMDTTHVGRRTGTSPEPRKEAGENGSGKLAKASELQQAASMKIAVIGAGGIGGWLGARLQQKGQDVVWIVRGANLEAMRKNGFHLQVVEGADVGLKTVQAFPNATEAAVAGIKVDCCLLCTKCEQLKDAAKDCAAILAPEGFVCTTQNGIEAPRLAAEGVGFARVVAGSCKTISHILEPGVVQHKSPQDFTFGEVFDPEGGCVLDARSDRVRQLYAAMSTPGITVAIGSGELVPSMWRTLWDKALTMCVVGPITALTRAPLEACLACPETKYMVLAAAMEVAQIADADGCYLSDNLAKYVTARYDTLEKTFKNNPGTTVSTTRDVLTGRPSELDDLTGGMLRAAMRLGVAVPVNRMIFAMLQPQERRARQEFQYSLNGVPGGVPYIKVEN